MAGNRDSHLNDWGSQIALGKVPDIQYFNKFGFNADVGTSEETIWAYGGEKTWLTTGTAIEVTCTDNTNGQGQVLQVNGLDENWTRQVQFVTLTGTTPAAVPGLWTQVSRVFQVSASPDPVGDVYISTTDQTYATPGVPDDATLVQGFVDFGDAAQQTQMAFNVIPAGYKGLIYKFAARLAGSSGGSARTCGVFLEVADLARGTSIGDASYAPRRRVAELQVSTTSIRDEIEYTAPLGPFPAYTRIEARGKASASCEIRASYLLVLLPA
jgi:hypothetical protein